MTGLFMLSSKQLKRQPSTFVLFSRMENNRIRTPNFSEREVILLEELLSGSSCILDTGVTKAAGWKEKKDEWKRLAIEFNARNYRFRAAETLRKKWDNMRKIRQNLAQRSNNTKKGEAKSKPNCDEIKEECTTGMLNTLVTGSESMFDCDGDSRDETFLIDVPVITELDPLSSGKEESKAKFVHSSPESVAISTPVSRIRKVRWTGSKHSEIVNNNCHVYTPTRRRAPTHSPGVTENKRRIKIPLTTKAKWRTLADIKIKLMAARLRHEREEHLLKTEALKAKRREEEKEHMLRVEEARFRRRCLEVQHQESHQEHIRRMEKLKRED